MSNSRGLSLFILFLLSFFLVQAQDYAVLNDPSHITTSCITNGTLNASGATIAIYDTNGAILLPTTTEYNITTGIFGVNITFPTIGKYVTVEKCNFSGIIVQGSEWIIVEENATLRSTTIINNQLYALSNTLNDTRVIVGQINTTVTTLNNSIFLILGNITLIKNNTDAINITVNQIQTITNLLINQSIENNNLLKKINETTNTTILILDSIQSGIANVTVFIFEVEMKIDSLQINVSNILDLELNETGKNFTNFSIQLQQIQESINMTRIGIEQVNITTNTILEELNDHINEENQSEGLEISYLQNISINISTMATVLNSISLNISAQNLTELNNSLTGLIIDQTAQATSFSFTNFLLILIGILFVVTLFVDKPIMYLVTGLLTFFGSFTLLSTIGVPLSLVITFIGIGCIAIGYNKIK